MIAGQELVVVARRFVDELVRAEHLEVRRAGALATALAAFVDKLGRTPSGGELEDFLDEHPQVEESYASRTVLEALAERLFRPPPPEYVTVASEPDLERQLRETLDPAPYLVYADWLQERGDPFGELIALGVAATTAEGGDVATARAARERFEAFLEVHEKVFLRGIKNTLGSMVELRWHNGFITHVGEQLDSIGTGRWDKLFDLRVAQCVRSLALQSVDAAVDELLATRAPVLRELALTFGSLPPKLLALPTLEALTLRHDTLKLDVGTLPPKLARLELQVRVLERAEALVELPALRELVLQRSMWRVDGSPFGALAGLALPQLARLELAGIDGTLAQLCERVLGKLALPAVRALAIRDTRVRASDVARLVALPWAGQLKQLAITRAALDDAAIELLEPLELDVLELDDNEVSPIGLARARAFATKVVVGKQRAAGASALDALRTFAGGRFAGGEAIAEAGAWKAARITGDVRWARYQGTDEYEVFVTVDLARYGCTCPSPYQPCKHVIALALVGERGELPAEPSISIASWNA